MTVDAETSEPAPHPYRWAMLGGVCSLYFCFGLTVSAMAPLVAPIAGELGLSHSAMGSILGAWPLAYIPSAVLCGALLDRIGPRRALFLAALVIALSGVLRSMADGHLSLFLAVMVFGIGGPMISVGAPKIIALWFAGGERGLAMGFYIASSGLGNVAAISLTSSVAMPLLGGDWRAVLMIYAGIALAAGVIWLAINSHGASRVMERRIAAEPKRPQMGVVAELLRLNAVRLIMITAVCMFFFNHSLNNWLPRILLDGGMDAASAGYWAALPMAVGILGALAIPRHAVPARRFTILFVLLIGAIAAPLLIQASAGVPLAVGLVLQGVARGAVGPILVLVLMETREVGASRMGTAGGLFFSAGEIGGVLGPLTMGYMADATGGFTASLYMLSGVAVVVMAILTRLRGASR